MEQLSVLTELQNHCMKKETCGMVLIVYLSQITCAYTKIYYTHTHTHTHIPGRKSGEIHTKLLMMLVTKDG